MTGDVVLILANAVSASVSHSAASSGSPSFHRPHLPFPFHQHRLLLLHLQHVQANWPQLAMISYGYMPNAPSTTNWQMLILQLEEVSPLRDDYVHPPATVTRYDYKIKTSSRSRPKDAGAIHYAFPKRRFHFVLARPHDWTSPHLWRSLAMDSHVAASRQAMELLERFFRALRSRAASEG